MFTKFLTAVFIVLLGFTLTIVVFEIHFKSLSEKEARNKLLSEQGQKNSEAEQQITYAFAEKPDEVEGKCGQNEILTMIENRESEVQEWDSEENKKDRPDLAQEQEFMRTMNPALGRPTRENLPLIIQQINASGSLLSSPGSASVPWVERGPSNVAGRTRAIIVDPNDATKKTIWAAGVDGGLWKTTDITVASPNWTPINDLFSNMAISCIAFDSTNNDTMYFGTGEGWYNLDAVKGFGIWRSTDKGVNWTQLSSTTGSSFNYINKIAVHPVNHKVYIGTKDGIYLSTNAGNSFTLIGYSGKNISDIEIANSGRVHIGIGDYFTTREYHYTDNDGTNWDPTSHNFNTIVTGGRRVELAVAPNNSAVLYALVGTTGAIQGIFKSVNSGITWTATAAAAWVDQTCASTSSDFTRGQSWYDLTIAINPNDTANVIIGGVDLLKTSNGGASWTQITSWAGLCSRQYVHADQHIIYFEPGSSTVAYFGNDGGIFRTTNANASIPTITGKNTNFNITQFYSCAVHPTSSSNIMLAGAQDNGTQRFSSAGINSTTEVFGGDGAYCFIDQTNPVYQITSYVYNNYYRSSNTGVNFTTTLNNSSTTGRFINPADYDDNLDILFSCKDTGSIWRVKSVTGTPTAATSVSIPGMGEYASHIRVSPYTASSSTVFVGTEGGKLYKVTGADLTPTRTFIGSASFPAGTISCVEIGANENELLVTFFNYGVTSVWYTSNGGTNWSNKEGNLPDMPVRWALFNPANRSEVLLATELGVWATTNFTATTPTWAASNTGLANVRVDMLQLRDADKMVFAATHGRGLYSSAGFSPAPIVAFKADNLSPCINQTVNFTDTSSLSPTSWSWSVSPASHTFVASTSANSQNPKIQFTATGVSYSITLTATNSFGSNAITKTNYITSASAISNNTINGSQSICQGASPTLFNGLIPTGGAAAVLAGTKVNEEFNGSLVPSGWNLSLNQNTLLSADNTRNSYGRSGTLGVIKADNFNVSSGSRAQLNTDTFTATIAPEVLTFDIAHATYPAYTDSFIIYTSSGSGFNRLTGWGSAQVVDTLTGGITTAIATTSVFSPSSVQWAKKSVSLPVGTVQVRFEFYSGFGNTIYFDRVAIDSFALPITYQWINSTSSGTTGFSAAGGTNNTQNYSSASLSVNTWFRRVVTSGGCASDTSAAILVTVNSLPSATATAASATTFCQGGNVTINANTGSGLTYQWRNNGSPISGATGASYVASASGNYKVVVTNSNSCSDSSGAVTVVVNSLPTATATASGSTTICQGGSVTINANTGSGLTYQWRKNGIDINGATGTSYTANTSGTYKVVVTNSNNCVDSSGGISVTVNSLPSASATAASATTFCQGGSVTLNANTGSGLTYQWRKDGTNINGATGSSYSASSTGNYKVIVSNSSNCSDSSGVISVTVNTLPTATATAASATTFCQGGSVTINANTGSGLTYQWRKNGIDINGATGISYTANTSGTYKVVVTNANSCIDSSSGISVTVNTLPPASATAASVTTFCQGGSVTLNANTGSGLTYQWRKDGTNINGATSSNYSATASGNYKVFVTNSSNCTDSSNTISITVNILPTATATASGATTFCQGGSVTINANTGSGLSYQWRKNGIDISGATASSYNANASGAYKVAVTNSNNCSDSSGAVNVTVNSLPTATATASGSIAICQGGSVTLNANTGSGLSYQWRKDGGNISGATSATYSATSTGNYKVVVTNSNNCLDSSNAISITVNSLPAATATAGGATTFCQGGSVTINANTGSGLSYQWRKNGIDISGATASSYNVNATGAYKVVVTNSNNCSDSSGAVNVTVSSLPTATAIAIGTTTICQGGSVTLNANTGSGLSYQWRKDGVNISGASSSTYSATAAGNYKVVVTNSNNCSDSSSAISITVNPLPNTTVSAAGPITFCQGGSVVLNANTGPGLIYEWRNNGLTINGASSASYTATSTGIFKVVITNAIGCKDSSTAISVIVNSSPANPVIIRNGFRLSTSTTASGYQWLRNDTSIVNAIQMNYDVILNGSYKLRITDANGCIAFSNIININNVGIGSGKIKVKVEVFPNPATVKIFVKGYGQTEEGSRFEIINKLGQVVLSDELKSGKTEIDISTLAAGVYLIKVGDALQSFVKE